MHPTVWLLWAWKQKAGPGAWAWARSYTEERGLASHCPTHLPALSLAQWAQTWLSWAERRPGVAAEWKGGQGVLWSFSDSCPDTKLCSGPRGPDKCDCYTFGVAGPGVHAGPQGKQSPAVAGQPQGRPQGSPEPARDGTRRTPRRRLWVRHRLLARQAQSQRGRPSLLAPQEEVAASRGAPGHRTVEWALCQSFEGLDRDFLIQTSEIDTSLHSNGCECIKKGGTCLKCVSVLRRN